MARRSSGMMWALLFGAGAVGYYVWKNSAAAHAAGAAASLLPGAGTSELPGSSAPTAQQEATAASFFDTLTPVNAIASGYIDFPSGSQAAAADFSNGLTRTDANGNYYVQWSGQTYLLGQMDAQGNWPATSIGS